MLRIWEKILIVKVMYLCTYTAVWRVMFQPPAAGLGESHFLQFVFESRDKRKDSGKTQDTCAQHKSTAYSW